MKHFLHFKDFNNTRLERVLSLAGSVKKKPGAYKNVLKDKQIGLLFEKPSLRTRVSCEVALVELGAYSLHLSPAEAQVGKREAIKDVAQTLSRYLDGLVIRTFSHEGLVEFSQYASIPVVNALSDTFHPLQILGDLFTIQEIKGRLSGLKVAYIGDANNVCNSLLYASTRFNFHFSAACPKGYMPQCEAILGRACPRGIAIGDDPVQAAQNADVLYTDVWTSMGKEAEAEKRKKIFRKYQINEKTVAAAKKDCIVMHCLPAHRGQEITDAVMDGPHSVVFQQAENRLYTEKALFMEIFA